MKSADKRSADPATQEMLGRIKKLSADIGLKRCWPVADKAASEEERRFLKKNLSGEGFDLLVASQPKAGRGRPGRGVAEGRGTRRLARGGLGAGQDDRRSVRLMGSGAVCASIFAGMERIVT